MDALISTIIPAFNSAHCIADAIKTVQDQSLQSDEIIVVDDGSSDDTAEIVRWLAISDPRIRLILHSQNKGASAARNTGIKAARGNYLVFLDSDDLWGRFKVAREMTALRNMPGADEDKFAFTYYGRRRRKRDDPAAFIRFTPKEFMPQNKGNTIEEMTKPRLYRERELERAVVSLRMWLFAGSTLMAHRSAIKKTGLFHEGLGFGEETEIVIRHMVRGGKLCMVPEILAIYTEPELIKPYNSRVDFCHYMHEHYRQTIFERWGARTGHDFTRRLYIDSAWRNLNLGNWDAAEREVLSLSALEPKRTPKSHHALACRRWRRLVRGHRLLAGAS